MKSVVLLRRRCVLWSTAMAACLLSGFILMVSRIPVPRVAQGSHSNPAAFRAGSAAQPRLVESYGKLPLSFEINKGQTDAQVKFLARGSGYALFLTGDEAVLSLRKPVQKANGKRQMAKGVAQGSHFNPAAFPGRMRAPATGMETNARTADPKTGSALHLLPTAEQFKNSFASNPESRTPDPDSQAPAVLRMRLVGANPHAKVTGLDQLPGKSNYFIGNDPEKWRANVPNYANVKYADVYPGVDLVYYGNQGKLEYDFVVQPGADPRSIRLAINLDERGAESQSAIDNCKSSIPAPLHVKAAGDLVLGTNGGEVTFHKPVVYQPATYNEPRTKNQEPVEGKYVVKGNHITFEVADYDRTRPLVIDPVLVYSTYLGNAGGSAIAVDASGNAYVTGSTWSSDFPTTPGAFQSTNGGGPGPDDAFVSKLNAAGSALIYSTYLGGSGVDQATGIAVDTLGNVYVTGWADSSDFPTTPGALQTTFVGCVYNDRCSDAFVSKLNRTGSALLYSTYLGGNGTAQGVGVAIDALGNAYVTGVTWSPNFPTTSGAFQPTFGGGTCWGDPCTDAFVSKLNAAGSALVYSTYLGGSGGDGGAGIAVDASGSAYVTGSAGSSDFPITPGAFQTTFGGSFGDAFVTKLNATGTQLVYSTYLGGGGVDGGSAIAVDGWGSAYVTGSAGLYFPTTPGAFEDPSNQGSFVTKLNPTGSTLVYSTASIGGSAIAVDAAGNAFITGGTGSSNFPTTPDAYQTTYGGSDTCYNGTPCGDGFVTKLNAAGSALIYSTYLGGGGNDGGYGIAVDASGNAYVTGSTDSSDFPTTPGAFQTTFASAGWILDAFVAKISFAVTPVLILAPSSVTFAPQALGTTSSLQQVRLANGGTETLDITTITPSGDFAQNNDCLAIVLPAGYCTLSVTFTPTVIGTRSGTVTITDNAPGSPQQLPLMGTGGVPAVSLTPASLTFASQAVGTTSLAQPATLTNTATVPLSITSIATSGDFTESNNCGSTVQAGAACTLNVTFTPTAGAVTITDNAAGALNRFR